MPLGEDKALVAALMRIDAKIRHAPDVLVTTSGRCYGRAPGGVADTLRLRSDDPDALCDEAFGAVFRTALRRAKWRRRLRQLWSIGDLVGDDAWMRALQISDGCALWAVGASTSAPHGPRSRKTVRAFRGACSRPPSFPVRYRWRAACTTGFAEAAYRRVRRSRRNRRCRSDRSRVQDPFIAAMKRFAASSPDSG